MMDNQEKWDRRFLSLAKEVSTWSKDPSTRVGCVLVKDGKVQGMGFNGFPRGVEDTPERYKDRDIKYPMAVHAEVNAILQAGSNAAGCDMYIYPGFGLPPSCPDCAGIAIQAGIIASISPLPNVDRMSRWSDEIPSIMWEEAGLEIRAYQEEE